MEIETLAWLQTPEGARLLAVHLLRTGQQRLAGGG